MKYEHSAKDKAKLNIKHYVNLKLQSESEHMVIGRLEAITRAIIEDIPGAAEWVNNRYSYNR
jgi:uncharacterized FlaG/YvyC family protein